MGKPPARVNSLSTMADQLWALTKPTSRLLTRFVPVCSLNKPYRTSAVPGTQLLRLGRLRGLESDTGNPLRPKVITSRLPITDRLDMVHFRFADCSGLANVCATARESQVSCQSISQQMERATSSRTTAARCQSQHSRQGMQARIRTSLRR
jgi:hypothetical protein